MRTTLGGFTPTGGYAATSKDSLWWKPCLTRAEGSGDTHVWFLTKANGSLYCPACASKSARVVIGPADWIGDIQAAMDAGDMRRVHELLADRARELEPQKPRWRDHADWLEWFKERAAMCEFLGGMKRPDAEARARVLAGDPP